MPNTHPRPSRVPQSRALRLLAAAFAVPVLLALSAAPISARPDGDSSSGPHGAGHNPPGQAVAEAHRPAHAGPPAHAGSNASGPPAPTPGAPDPKLPRAAPSPPVAASPDPDPVPAAPAIPPAPVIPAAPTPATDPLPAPAILTPVAPGSSAATTPEPAPSAAPEPAIEPAFPAGFPAGSGSGAEAARSLTAFGLLAGLMALFLVVQGRFTRGDAKLLEAPVESEERVFR